MKNTDLFNLEYMAVPITSLFKDSRPNFDAFIKYDNDFVLFVASGNLVTHEALERLVSSDLQVLYVNRKNIDAYEEYSSKMINSVQGGSREILEKKSKVLYESAKNVMNALFSSEVGKKEILSSKVVAMDLVREITSDKKAFLSLVRVSSHDYYTYTHSINVCMYSVAIGEQLMLGKNDLKLLAEGALLHDIGKSKIDNLIINKNTKLTPNEFEAIKMHPVYGAEILKHNGEYNQTILGIISQHHEKLNGRGYPLKLDRYEINRLSQIVTIADVFDALTTKRSYKDAMTTFEAFSLMHTSMKEELNMDILNKFISNFRI